MLNRREMVMGLGAIGGMGGLQVPAIAAEQQSMPPSPRAVKRRIQLSGSAEQKFLSRLGRSPSAPARLPAPISERATRPAHAVVVEAQDGSGRPFVYGLRFMCDPRVVNQLMVDGEPFEARRICFSTEEIAWTPGPGFPVYRTHSPRFEYDAASYYPAAKSHQLVPRIGTSEYFTGCQSTDVCEAASAGQIAFDVNSRDYSDNHGTYAVQIWSWS